MQNIGPVCIVNDVLLQKNKKEEINLPKKSVLLINKPELLDFPYKRDHKL